MIRNGERNGYGKLIWKSDQDNDVYEGNFKSNY